VFGADVHNPGVGLTGRPSIAAVVASLDSHFVRHAAVVRAQEHRKEVIQDLQGAVIELLKIFYQTSGQNPTRIVFLRDGVSEGQFRQASHSSSLLQVIEQVCACLVLYDCISELIAVRCSVSNATVKLQKTVSYVPLCLALTGITRVCILCTC
jgi:Piwi domain